MLVLRTLFEAADEFTFDCLARRGPELFIAPEVVGLYLNDFTPTVIETSEIS